MKSLFIYYSNTGNGDMVADYLGKTGVEVRKVAPQKPLPRAFVPGVLTGGFLASIGHKSKLQDWDNDTKGYDTVIVGSPVWNGRFSAPINRVLADLQGTKPRAFVLYAGSGTAPKAQMRIEKEYPEAKVVVLKDPKKYPDELAKLDVLMEKQIDNSTEN